MKAAIYARYSTDLQRKESIADQHRVCEGIAARHELKVVARYSDAAISGGTTDRPGYQEMLTAARNGEFNVIIAEDTSRLWRNMAEQSPRMAELRDLRIRVITHDLDTNSESAGMLGAVLGASAEHYRQEIARRTRRGLEGLARSKKSTGGRAFGYVSQTASLTHKRAIDPVQAAVVLEIFERYADGASAMSLARDLNKREVPSPGSHWKNRRSRRKKGWMTSAISGDPRKATGILNNDVYIGRVVWNRTRWVRSAKDSSKRESITNPPTEWIVHTDESLRIIPQELWNRVKERQRLQSEAIGDAIRKGLARGSANGYRRGGLLSGSLTCACGANFVSNGNRTYACDNYRHGSCSNNVLVNREIAEARVETYVNNVLLSDANVARLSQFANEELAARQRSCADRQPELQARISKLGAKIDNLTEAIASGELRSSPALAASLNTAEADKAAAEADLRAAIPVASVVKLIPRLADRARAKLEAWRRASEAGSPDGVPIARGALQSVLGGPFVVEGELIPGTLKKRPVGVLQAPGAGLLKAAVGSRFPLTDSSGSGGVISAVPSIPQSARLK